jgi:hypothetical protein
MEQHHQVQPSATWFSPRFPQMASRVLLLRSPLHQVILILQPIFRWELKLEASLLFWCLNAKASDVYKASWALVWEDMKLQVSFFRICVL